MKKSKCQKSDSENPSNSQNTQKITNSLHPWLSKTNLMVPPHRSSIPTITASTAHLWCEAKLRHTLPRRTWDLWLSWSPRIDHVLAIDIYCSNGLTIS